MSTENFLARHGLWHLADKPEELSAEIHRRLLVKDNSTIEELEKSNAWRIKRGQEPIDIPKYLEEREAAKKDEERRKKEKNIRYIEEEQASGIRKVLTCMRCGVSYMNWWFRRKLSKEEVEEALKLGYKHEYDICSERCYNSHRT